MFTEAVFIEETTALCSAPKSRWWVDPTIWPRSSASTRAGLVVSAVGVRLAPREHRGLGAPGNRPRPGLLPLRLGSLAPAQMVVAASMEGRVAVGGKAWVYRMWQSR